MSIQGLFKLSVQNGTLAVPATCHWIAQVTNSSLKSRNGEINFSHNETTANKWIHGEVKNILNLPQHGKELGAYSVIMVLEDFSNGVR